MAVAMQGTPFFITARNSSHTKSPPVCFLVLSPSSAQAASSLPTHFFPRRKVGGLKGGINILAEGAQGFGLDIDWGDYPFVTSSHCTTAGALLNGLPPGAINDVWGVAKIYETYVGSKKFQPEGAIFDTIGDIGEEFGATTGRRRQVNWMNMQTAERAIRMNGVTHVVFNKVDVLREAGEWAVIDSDKVVPFQGEQPMQEFVRERLRELNILPGNIFFSESKDKI